MVLVNARHGAGESTEQTEGVKEPQARVGRKEDEIHPMGDY